MRKLLNAILEKEKIEYFGIIPFDRCKVINHDLYDRSFADWKPKSVIMMLAPYYSGEYEDRNISLYAASRDYHLYFKELYERIGSVLTDAYPTRNFAMFSDHSPISEIYAAAKAGLGVVGDKFQLINEKYGSYTFIGEIFTDAEFDAYDLHEVAFCSHCGNCSEACPMEDGCLSELTQRKGELNEDEAELIRINGTAWGCDLCRTSCPMNRDACQTPIEFFRESLITHLTSEEVNAMTKAEFRERAFAWRGKATILRNLKILEMNGK